VKHRKKRDAYFWVNYEQPLLRMEFNNDPWLWLEQFNYGSQSFSGPDGYANPQAWNFSKFLTGAYDESVVSDTKSVQQSFIVQHAIYVDKNHGITS
jgi:hypothetical protein